MNDFTKEELQHILWVFNESYEFNDRLMDDIRVKTKSLIDIYCEHPQTYYSNGVKFDCMDCKKQKDSNEKENII